MRNQKKDVVIERVASHRNGISGNSFHAILFTNEDDRKMVGVVFEEYGNVAVFDRTLVGQHNIDFFNNSWRGDHYEGALRRAVRDYLLAQQLLPTDQWAPGWSPGVNPAIPYLVGDEITKFAEYHQFPADEVEHLIRLLQNTQTEVERRGGEAHVFRWLPNPPAESTPTPYAWGVSFTGSPEESERSFTVYGPDTKAGRDLIEIPTPVDPLIEIRDAIGIRPPPSSESPPKKRRSPYRRQKYS